MNLLREKLSEWLLESKRKISIEVVSYVCCMQRMQHIFNKQLIDCVDIETSLLHWQCHWVIDEKISDRIIISNDESESRDYSAWRSSDLSIMLIYWESLNASSLLDIKSHIYLREKLRAHENDQNAFSTIDQSHALNDYDCTFILTIYLTSTWYKSNQEKKRII